MTHHPLGSVVRLVVSLSVLVFLLTLRRAFFRSSRPPAWFDAAFGAALCIAVAFTHVPALRDTLVWSFPIGGVVGWAAAGVSLAMPRARAAFDRIGDADARLLLSFRMFFGAVVFVLATIGAVPAVFALTAGVGDLVVGAVAVLAPGRLDVTGRRLTRIVVHGLGLLDIVQAAFLAVTMVRPWSIANGNTATFMALPWVGVPLMFALNAHGIRQAYFARTAEPLGDGSEPPGRLRGALSRT